MQMDIKLYKAKQVKSYIKNSHFFLIVNGVNKTAFNWIKTEQELKELDFSYYKLRNKISIKKLQNSIYKKTLTALNGSTFFIKPDSTLIVKHILLHSFKPLLFFIFALKINNKLYSYTQLNINYSVKYEKTKMLISQFITTQLKFYYNVKH